MNFENWMSQLREKGWIQPIRFGMSREDVRAVFGDPDDVGQGWRKAQAPMILLYGRVEFHFGPQREDGLGLIFSENDEGVVELCLKHGVPR